MKIKVCGMKYPDNILEVASLRPDYMGFIFYKGSKRFVGDDFEMPEIDSSIKKVGVFVNEQLEIVYDKINRYKLDFVQLHGNESPEFCEHLPGSNIIKAFGVSEAFDFSALEEYTPFCKYFLFDSIAGQTGGSGKKFNWAILSAYQLDIPYFLSGGIGPGDKHLVEKASQDPYLCTIDVNSKFEIEPGLKDVSKLKILINEIHGR